MSPDPGTGTLVLVVGPSGAGKDSLIDRAREALLPEGVVFPRRIVTRPASAAEIHDTLAHDAFSDAAAHDAFAFQWQAHGLDYAIPAAIGPALAAGATVVCNVSRGIVALLRDRYPRVTVIYVDAPLALRMSRIAGRSRPTDQPGRASRVVQAFKPGDADVVIDNGGALNDAAAAFIAAIRSAAEPEPVAKTPPPSS